MFHNLKCKTKGRNKKESRKKTQREKHVPRLLLYNSLTCNAFYEIGIAYLQSDAAVKFIEHGLMSPSPLSESLEE